jgi:glyceraldehyde 3-phosphate dehydrogenase
MLKVAINGFGRIGRHSLKVAWDREDMEIVAINDLTDNKTLAHLLKYDTAYPDWSHEISYDEENIIIDGKKIRAFAEKDPSQLPWGELEIDVVMESTGIFRTSEKAGLHLQAGAKKVVLSAPGKGDDIETYVRGINCESYSGAKIIDNASCTTNCTAPVVQALHKKFGVEKALLNTIHAYTSDQNLQDAPHSDLRRARAAAQNMVPTSTGAAKATTKVIPDLAGKFDGMAIRVPTITVSLVDFSMVLKQDVTVEEINTCLKEASETYLKGILAVTEEPLVSSDFIGNPYSSTADLGLTKVAGGNLVKVISWYDNEWGYANRLVEMVEIVGRG